MPFTTVSGARIYWKLEGREDAPPLVLLNSIGTDMDLWDLLLPPLRRRFALLRIDTRGHGASLSNVGDYSLPQLADDLLAVIEDAGIAKAAVAGVSLGGMIAMEAALARPDAIKALALVCTSAGLDRDAWADRVAKVRSEGMAAIADLAMERFLSPAFVSANPDISATIRRQLVTMDPFGYAGCAAAIRDLALADRLGEIGCPALVVTGRQDISTPYDGHGEHLVRAIPNACHVSLDAAHLAPLEAPDALADALIAFLRN